MTSSGRLGWRTFVTVGVVAVAVVVGMLLISDGEPTAGPGPDKETSVAPSMSQLVFAVWGTDEEVAAYQEVADEYNATSVVADVEISAWPDEEAMMTAIEDEEIVPDLFLLPRTELAATIEAERNRPLLDLLDARGVSFGDDYSRDAIAAFSADDTLQCMPYGASPMVMYVNTDLVDFDRMEARGLPVPDEERDRWTLDQFRAAAEFASRPRTKARGVYIEPTLDGLAPFVYSGGGSLFDDDVAPTSLALSEDASAEAMRSTLEILRDPTITLTDAQVSRKSALEWFQEGRLGMIAGYRDLTPVLRSTEGLDFDVMPMPQLGSSATVGDLVGLCVGNGPQDRVEQAADFLVYMVSDDAVSQVAETGYLVPSNIRVGFSDSFVQLGEMPVHARTFINSNSIVLMPLIDTWTELEAAVEPSLRRLLQEPVLEDLDAELAAIDEESRAVLSPEQESPTDESTSTEDTSDTP